MVWNSTRGVAVLAQRLPAGDRLSHQAAHVVTLRSSRAFIVGQAFGHQQLLVQDGYEFVFLPLHVHLYSSALCLLQVLLVCKMAALKAFASRNSFISLLCSPGKICRILAPPMQLDTHEIPPPTPEVYRRDIRNFRTQPGRPCTSAAHIFLKICSPGLRNTFLIGVWKFTGLQIHRIP